MDVIIFTCVHTIEGYLAANFEVASSSILLEELEIGYLCEYSDLDQVFKINVKVEMKTL